MKLDADITLDSADKARNINVIPVCKMYHNDTWIKELGLENASNSNV